MWQSGKHSSLADLKSFVKELEIQGGSPRVDSIFMLGFQKWGKHSSIWTASRAGFKVYGGLVKEEPIHCNLQELEEVVEGHVEFSLQDLENEGLEPLLKSIRTILPGRFFAYSIIDEYCELAAEINAALGVPCYPASAAKTTREKDRMRAVWNALCDSHPELPLHPIRYQLFQFPAYQWPESSPSLEQWVLSSSGPWILKPNDGFGSIEVRTIHEREQILPELQNMLEAYKLRYQPMEKFSGIHLSPSILLEERIPRSQELPAGAEYCFDFVSVGSLHASTLLIQKWLLSPQYQEVGIVAPDASLSHDVRELMESCTVRLLEILEVENAVSHWEFIVTDENRLCLIEGHVRRGGDIAEWTQIVQGLNHEETFFRLLRGMSVDEAAALAKPDETLVMWWTFAPSKPVRDIEAVEIKASFDWVEDFVQLWRILPPGKFWRDPADLQDWLFSLTIRTPSVEEGIRRFKQFGEQVSIRGKGEDGEPVQVHLQLPLSNEELEFSMKQLRPVGLARA